MRVAQLIPPQEGDDPSGRRWDRRAVITVLIIFALALAIRLVALGSDSFWIDEGATAANAAADVEVILDGQEDKHPPGYYLAMHYVSAVSDTETALRLPSAVASSLTVLLVVAACYELFARRIAVLAGLLLALSPLAVWFAQEARQPAVTTMLVAVAVFGLVRGSVVGHIVAVVGLFTALLVDWVAAAGWLAFSGVWVYLSWNRNRTQSRDWAIVTGIAFLGMVPLQGARFWDGFGILQESEGPGTWYGAVLGSNPVTANPVGILAAIFLGALGASWVVDRLLRTSLRQGLAWITVAGYGLAVLLLPIPRAFSVKKIIVVGWPIVIVFVAVVIMTILAPRYRSAAAGLVIALSVVGLVATMLVPKDDWRAAVAYVNTHADAQDVAWIQPDPWSPGVYDYYRGALPVHIASNPGDTAVVQSPTGDVWLITKRRPQDSIPALEAEAWFDENWRLIESSAFYRVEVRHYTAN